MQNAPRTHPPVPNPPATGTGPDPMDLSGTGYGKLSEQECATRIREGLCLYCGKPGHMARHCPSKSKNPFRAASTYVEGNPNVLTNPNPGTRLRTGIHLRTLSVAVAVGAIGVVGELVAKASREMPRPAAA